MMGLKFGTQELIDEYIDKLNNNKVYEDAAKTWEGDFIFDVEPDGGLEEEIQFYIDLNHGKARNGRQLQPGEEQPSAYVFKGKWSSFVLLMDGKIGPIKALLMGKFSLVGNKAAVMRAVKATQQLVETIKMVDTERY